MGGWGSRVLNFFKFQIKSFQTFSIQLKAVWKFCENSSILVLSPVTKEPKELGHPKLKWIELFSSLSDETRNFIWDRYRDFFWDQIFWRPIPRLFLRPNVFETDTETFFETKCFWDRDWNFFKTRFFETDTETF